MFNFKNQKVIIDQELGRGPMSRICAYKKVKEDERWIVKWISVDEIESVLSVMESIVLGYNCTHHAILPIKGYYIDKFGDKWNVYIKMSRMCRNLKEMIDDYFSKEHSVPENDILRCFYTLACGLDYLHNDRKIAHGNLKPTNVLFDKGGNIKLTDIYNWRKKEGLATNSLSYKVHSLYTAPELTESQLNSKKDLIQADMWSLGILIAELCILSAKSTRSIGLISNYQDLKKIIREQEGRYSKELIELILSLLTSKPSKRKSSREIREYLEEIFVNALNPIALSERRESFSQSRLIENFENVNNVSIYEREQPRTYSIIDQLEIAKAELQEEVFQDILDFEENKVFSLRCSHTEKMTDKALTDAMNEMKVRFVKHNIKNLEAFEFSVPNCKNVTGTGIKNLFINLGSSLNKLQTLSLNFAECENISKKNIREFGHLQQLLKSLESFTLNFSGCQNFENEAVLELSNLIATNAKNLLNLSLNFQNTMISDNGILGISNSFANKLQTLERFELNLSNTQITDKGIKLLTALIKSMMLKKLLLHLARCNQISSGAAEKLCFEIKERAPGLKTVFLDFSECTKINQKTQHSVLLALSIIPELTVLFNRL